MPSEFTIAVHYLESLIVLIMAIVHPTTVPINKASKISIGPKLLNEKSILVRNIDAKNENTDVIIPIKKC